MTDATDDLATDREHDDSPGGLAARMHEVDAFAGYIEIDPPPLRDVWERWLRDRRA